MLVAAVDVCITTSGSCSRGNPLVVTLLPAVIGAGIGFLASVWLRRSDREWQRTRDQFTREMQIVQPLDEALVATQRLVQGYGVPDGESRWGLAHREWEAGWVALTPHLTDDELEARFQSVGTILMEMEDREADQKPPRGMMMRVAMRAIANARLTLAYWLRGDPLPAASFPSSAETIALLGQGDPTPLASGSPLRAWLDAHEQPPWRVAESSGRPWLRRGRRR